MQSALNPFRDVARKLKEQRLILGTSPYPAYLDINKCLISFKRNILSRVRISFEAASLMARLMLLGKPLSFVTYICVSDYVGSTRIKEQKEEYSLTKGECLMLKQAITLRDIALSYKVNCNWRLILADGWGKSLFGSRCIPGALDMYCDFMIREVRKLGLECVKWSDIVEQHKGIYELGCDEVEGNAEKLSFQEALIGEIAHDKPEKDEALKLAKQHIQMRAAESRVILEEYGPTIVLSTETKKLVRYDNLLVPREDYTHIFAMPFYPHRLP